MMMYKKYKETGYKHIPTIPEHWEIKKHRSFLVEQKSINSNDEGTLLSLSQYTGVSIKTNTDKQGMFRAESLVGYRIVHPQDIVMNIMLAWNGSTACSKFEGVISPAYAVFKVADNGIAPDYLHYLYRIPEMCGYFKAYSTGIIDSRLRLYPQIFMQLYSVIPPRDEQDQIVRYLDWQVSKINHLIHSYQKQIKLLEERKITLIDNAVTKGINSDATMQHILGCWMGNIPAHWRMIPSKRVFVEGKERRREGDVSATASQKYGIISQEEYMRRENRRIVVANQGLDDWKHVEPGNFVISLRSFQGGIELCEITGCVTWHYIVLLPQEMVCTQYFKWLLKSKSYIKALQGTSEFIRDGQDLRYSNFVKVDLPLIPLEEQKAIAEYITAEVAKIDNAIPVYQKEIEQQREYRTRLISDVVTGQIDVRDVVIPEYTPEEDVESSADEDVEEVAENAE